MSVSAIASPHAASNRPSPVAWAVWITVALAVGGLLLPLVPAADVPGFAIVIGGIGSVLMLVGVWGLWNLCRWGAVLTIVLTLLNVIASVPPIFEAPSNWIRVAAIVGIPLQLAVLALIALPESRRAYRKG
jgi:hypothetical protein